jgi:hypothetical protein
MEDEWLYYWQSQGEALLVDSEQMKNAERMDVSKEANNKRNNFCREVLERHRGILEGIGIQESKALQRRTEMPSLNYALPPNRNAIRLLVIRCHRRLRSTE